MRVTLNYEAPGKSTIDLALILQELFATCIVRTRVQDNSYVNEQGIRVEVKTFISRMNTPLGYDAIVEAVFALSCKLDQDCIAVRFETAASLAANRAANQLIGPRADKWLPFNPEYFVEY